MAVQLLSKDPAYANDPTYRSKLLKEFGFEEEEAEVVSGEYQGTGFPKSLKHCRLSWEV